MNAWPSISALASNVASGKIKATDLVAKSLAAIEDKSEYNAIIAVVGERA